MLTDDQVQALAELRAEWQATLEDWPNTATGNDQALALVDVCAALGATEAQITAVIGPAGADLLTAPVPVALIVEGAAV